jgi:putative transposase
MCFKRSVRTCKYHIIWTPKYRKPFLNGLIRYHVSKAIKYKAIVDLGIFIENMEIMPDHIHLFISIKPCHNISCIVQQLKGYSSFIVRKELNLTKYKALWGKGYFCESVGQISESTIKKYISNQWKHYRANSSSD